MKSLIAHLATFIHRLRHRIRLSSADYERRVEEVADYGEVLSELSDDDLRQRIESIRDQVRDGSSLDLVSVEAAAMVREAAERTIGLRPYDVQMLAAFAMLDRQCVEMQTGEGKTLAAAITVSLLALQGRGVHVLTFNDYLSERDALWMGPLYRFLGLSVGHVVDANPLPLAAMPAAEI